MEEKHIQAWINSIPYTKIKPFYYRCQPLTFKYKRQIIYVEDKYNTGINDYIKRNIDLLKGLFYFYSLSFIYLPHDIKLEQRKEAIIDYTFPMINSEMKKHLLSSWDNFSSSQFSHTLYSSIGIPLSDLKPGLLLITYWDENTSMASFVELQESNDEGLSSTFVNYFRVKGSLIEYCPKNAKNRLISTSDHFQKDDLFNREIGLLVLVKEVKEKIERLKIEGYFELLLQTLRNDIVEEIKQKSTIPLLSELVVTGSFKIHLPGYNNLQIEMSPLPKAVYILFLRHPNGIRFKMLPAYNKELWEIYKHVSPFHSIKKMKQSIDMITDPTHSTINEKCSRIREAFLMHFDNYFSRHYYITGNRGKKEKVMLPMGLVRLPKILDNTPITIIDS